MPISLYKTRRPTFGVTVKSLGTHFKGPSYTAQDDKRAGGKKSTATLGPNSLTGMGSDANAKLPSAITAVRKKYPDETFIAGHLLNADFGGEGKNAKNITILTSKGNSAHKKFDEPVKAALQQLQKAYFGLHRAGVDIRTVSLGIEVTIEVTGSAWGPSYPENCVFDELTCTAKVADFGPVTTFVNALEANAGEPAGEEPDDEDALKAIRSGKGGRKRSAPQDKPAKKIKIDPEVIAGIADFRAALKKVRQKVAVASTVKVENKQV